MKPLGEWLKRAFASHQQGQFAEAERLYRKVLKADRKQFDALHLLGVLKHQQGDNVAALPLVAAALKVNPNDADALLNYGNILSGLSRHKEALPYFDKVLAISPTSVSALNNRGNALAELKRYDEALACLERAVTLDRSYAKSFVNRGNVLMDLGRHAEALESYETALRLRPNDVDILNNRGKVFTQLNRLQEALACFDRALYLQPGHADAQLHMALVQLALGDFINGWKRYEWRWKAPTLSLPPRNFPQPRWNGEYVKGTLLAWGEQGLGDEILYSSMAPDLAGHADSVALEVEPRLVKLFARSFPKVCVIGRGEPLPDDIQAQSPLVSLGQYLRPIWDAFPAREHGYLVADDGLAANLRRRLTPESEIVVGLSWVSKNPTFGQLKTAQLRDFESVLRLPGCRYVDLQYGDTLTERDAFKAATGITVERLKDVDNTNDIDALAALIAACDLVVTVSNTTAHLAGALGKPTYVFVPASRGRIWYWFTDRGDSPWYPRVRLKRQKDGQSWKDSIASATDEIAAFVQEQQVRQPA